MAPLISCNTEKVLGLRGGICLGKANQDLLKTLDGLLKVILVEFRLALAKNELGDEILRRQESDKPVVFIAISVEDNDGGGPFDTKSLNQGLVLIEINLNGNEFLFHGEADVRIGVGNSCQLLTPNSEVIVKVHQDQFFLLLRLCLGCGERGLPLDLFSHNEPPFFDFISQNREGIRFLTPLRLILNEPEAIVPEAALELIAIVSRRSETIKIPFSLLNSPNQFRLR